jgi:hypothetical protein
MFTFGGDLYAYSSDKRRLNILRKSHQSPPIFTHPLHHPANATLFPAKSAQEPVESPVFL